MIKGSFVLESLGEDSEWEYSMHCRPSLPISDCDSVGYDGIRGMAVSVIRMDNALECRELERLGGSSIVIESS